MTQLRKVRIAGTGAWAPERVLTNSDLEKMVDTSDDWIFTRTGIRERRIAEPGTGASVLALEASRRALDAAGVKGEEIDFIIVGTITPDTVFPSTACRLQRLLNAERAAAVDMSAACSGFIYALATGWQFVRSGMYQKVLVVGAECMSSIMNFQDRASCIIFGDGAGAVVLLPSQDESEILFTSLGALGDDRETMIIPAGGSLLPASHETVDQQLHYVQLRGREVYKFAVSKMVEEIESLVKKNGLSISDLSLIIPHQVNMRIIESAMERLSLPLEKAYMNIDRFGNTSAASIPMALDEVVRSGRIKRGDLLAFVAFGGGMTWGSTLVRW